MCTSILREVCAAAGAAPAASCAPIAEIPARKVLRRTKLSIPGPLLVLSELSAVRRRPYKYRTPILLELPSVNQIVLFGPGATMAGPDSAVGIGNSVTEPLGVMR